MKKKYIIIGAGMQGCAIAHDLARTAKGLIVLVDNNPDTLEYAKSKLYNHTNINYETLDCTNKTRVQKLINDYSGFDSMISAAPYMFNLELTKIAANNDIHFCDLGGNTDIVKQQLQVKTDKTILPDCGLAPGVSNLFSKLMIDQFKKCYFVHVYCGGIPEEEEGIFGYKEVFNLNGLINEYSGTTEIINNGKIEVVKSLSALEEFNELYEADITTGGTSLAAHSFLGKVDRFVYKTLRYHGHFDKMRILKDAGLFDEGIKRDLLISIFSQCMNSDIYHAFDIGDQVLLHIDGFGMTENGLQSKEISLKDVTYNDSTFTAMERCTGFPTSIIAQMQVSAMIKSGANTIENVVDPQHVFDEMLKRGFELKLED